MSKSGLKKVSGRDLQVGDIAHLRSIREPKDYEYVTVADPKVRFTEQTGISGSFWDSEDPQDYLFMEQHWTLVGIYRTG